ncbi:MAG: O-antigen ligase family protein [Gemmatimonas sp.]
MQVAATQASPSPASKQTRGALRSVLQANGLTPPPLKSAWTVGTASLVMYLFLIHSYKVPIVQEVLAIGIAGVLLFARPLRMAPSLTWYAAFLAWALITLPITPNVAVSWAAWVLAFKVWLIMFLVFNAVRTQGHLRLVMLAYLGFFALYPVRGTLFNFASGNESFGRYAWNFTFSNFNDLAALTIIPLGFAVDRLRSAEAKWVKLCALAGLLVLPFLVLITQSRGGMLGMAVFFIVLLARSRHRLRFIVALAAVGGIAVLFAPKAVMDRIVGMQYLTSTTTLSQSDASAEQRYQIALIAATVAKENPVLGVGIGAYPLAHARYALRRADWIGARGSRDSHNSYLHVLAENGVIGFGLFIMSFVTTLRELSRTARSVKNSQLPADKELRDRCLAFQATLAGLAVCGIFGTLDTMVFPFLLMAIIAAAVRMPRSGTAAVPAAVPAKSIPRFRGGWRPQSRAIAR